MSFAAEVAQAKTSAPEVTAPPPTVDAAQEFAFKAPETVETIEPAPKSGRIKIGSEVFESAEDAIRYAEEMQTTLLQKDAFEQGRLSTQAKEEAPAEVDPFDEMENGLFEDPKGTMKKIYSKAVEDAKKQVREEQVREQNIRQTWDGFYSSNADLAQAKDLVDYMLQKSWSEIGHLPVETSLKILADKTRALIGSKREASLPSRELQSGPALSPGASSSATKSVPKDTKVAVDFISQINKHRRRITT